MYDNEKLYKRLSSWGQGRGAMRGLIEPCVFSVATADVCLNSHLGVNGGGGEGHGGCLGAVAYLAVSLGLGGVKGDRVWRMGCTKNGMITMSRLGLKWLLSCQESPSCPHPIAGESRNAQD